MLAAMINDNVKIMLRAVYQSENQSYNYSGQSKN